MKVISIRFFVIAIVGILTLPLGCGDCGGGVPQNMTAQSFKLGFGSSYRDSLSLYLLNEYQSRTSDSITFILNVDKRSYHSIPNPYASIRFHQNQLFACDPVPTPMFTEKIIDIKISSSDTIRTNLKTYPPRTELGELFYVQQYQDYSYYKIKDLTPKEGAYNADDRKLTTYLFFRDSIQPIVNQKFSFTITMSDSTEFSVSSHSMTLE